MDDEERRAHHAAYMREWVATHPEQWKVICKRTREKNKERIAAGRKIYADAHKEETASYKKRYNAEHRDTIRASRRMYWQDHREEQLVKSAEYRQNHRKELLETQKEYQKHHPEVRRAYLLFNKKSLLVAARDYYHEHRIQCINATRAWQKNHKEQHREILKRQSIKRRGLIEGGRCDLTAEQWGAIKNAQHGKCKMCGKAKLLTQDHIIPIALGGEHTAWNIQGLCRSCNSRKGTRIVQPIQLRLAL